MDNLDEKYSIVKEDFVTLTTILTGLDRDSAYSTCLNLNNEAEIEIHYYIKKEGE